jgi:hypothetical protein
VAELAERYKEVFGKDPRVKHREHLQRKIAWQIQAERFGGLSETAQRRLDEIIADLDLPFDKGKKSVSAALRRIRKPNEPAVGTVLVRKWKGAEIRVQVQDNGYEWDGIVYRSLSAVAKAITGSHWNGRLFFKLVSRKRRCHGKG